MASDHTPTTNTYTDEEQQILNRHFTNLHDDIFAIHNLPEVVKGALFARYSRSAKPLRRLFLDEFADDLPHHTTGDNTETHAHKAAALYDRVFGQYGDDSVAQLGGAHIAVENISNIATKLLERGRLASYLEQSTRYIPYSQPTDGHWRYKTPTELTGHPTHTTYTQHLNTIFELYAHTYTHTHTRLREQHPNLGEPTVAYNNTMRAKALDLARGMLPAATQANVGVYASGQAYEAMIMRLLAHPLEEAQHIGARMLEELRHIIPSFLTRIDLKDRGQLTIAHLQDTTNTTAELAHALFGDTAEPAGVSVTLVDFDPDAETKAIAHMLYPHTHQPLDQLTRHAHELTPTDGQRIIDAYVGNRTNRRHKPGRALEIPVYTFDIVCDYGAYRDLQRHRMCTIEQQTLTPHHGYTIPEGLGDDETSTRAYHQAMTLSAELYDTMCASGFHTQAPYAVALGYNMRFTLTLNAREAMHLCELRSQPSGHASYRKIAQQMHTLISTRAGHHAIAGAMSFVDHTDGADGRLEAERRTAQRTSD